MLREAKIISQRVPPAGTVHDTMIRRVASDPQMTQNLTSDEKEV
jgi:hypothetical protein